METKQELAYGVGDWLVHARYGVGQIEAVEEMFFAGEDQLCYRVKTKDSTFWAPVDQVDNKRIRPLADPERIEKALKVLERPSEPLSKDYKERDKQIKARLDRTLRSKMRVIRDLTSYDKINGLSKSNRNTLDQIRQGVLEEWSVCMHIPLNDARQRLDQLLRENLAVAVQKE